MIAIDKSSNNSLYLQLYNSIKREIVNGGLKPGDKLPSYRFLTVKFNINAATVIKAYSMLEDAGIIEIKQGSGCYVKALNSQHFSNGTLMVDCFHRGQGICKEFINLASNSPYIDTYPISEIQQILREVSEKELSECFSYGASKGNLSLRQNLCGYFAQRQIETEPNRIQIVNGSQQGLDLIARFVIKRDSTIAVENPGYTIACNTFQSQKCRLEYVPIEQDGIDIDALRQLLNSRKIDFFYAHPNYQTPTSICYSDEKKRELIELARKYGFLIIEDDCMSDLSFDASGKRSLISYGASDCVIHIRSFSKILMPGFRTAAIIAPPQFEEKLVVGKFYGDISSAELLQRCLSIFIEQGRLEEHLTRSRKIYKAKYLKIKSEIEQTKTLSLAYEPDGGLFLWVRLNCETDPYDFYNAMREEGILLIPGNVYSYTGQHSRYLHIGFCSAKDSDISIALQKIDRYLSR